MLGLLRTPITFDNSNGASNPTDPTAFLLADGTQRDYRGGPGYDNPYWVINRNPFHEDLDRYYGSFERSMIRGSIYLFFIALAVMFISRQIRMGMTSAPINSLQE